MSDYFKDKMAAMVWTAEGGAQCLHVHRNWTADEITSHVDDECRRAFGGKQHAVAVEVAKFGELARPKRRFERSDGGRWIEVPAQRWSKQATADHKKRLAKLVERASKGEDVGVMVSSSGLNELLETVAKRHGR